MTYNRFAVARTVRVKSETAAGMTFVSKSMTDASDDSDRYNPTISADGAVSCGCGDFQHRKRYGNPNAWSPDSMLCKHLVRARATAKRHHRLAPKCCHKCGVVELDLSPLCDDNGNDLPGQFICKACLHAVRALNKCGIR